MKATIIGTGYVGLVSGACFAELGHDVTCVDIDKTKIDRLNQGQVPIYEEGLEGLIKKHHGTKLTFTTDLKEGLRDTQIIFSAVGTPSDAYGKVDLQYVQTVARQVAENLESPAVFVNKSTVPVGTGELVFNIIKDNLKHDVTFTVASNPEFLREGVAVYDTMNPDRIIIGVADEWAEKTLREFYQKFIEKGVAYQVTNIPSAEMIKYASNCFLALKISFINEIAELSEQAGANIKEISQGLGSDSRIGPHFLQPGPGYGGSCFPKDVSGLVHTAHEYGVDLKTLESVLDVNDYHRLMPIRKLKKYFPNLQGKHIGVLGLAFKPNSDDVRESSSYYLIQALLNDGARVKAYDPMATDNFKTVLDSDEIEYASEWKDALKDLDALVLMTHWDEFRTIDPLDIKKQMRGNVVVDTRNFWDKDAFVAAELRYDGVGY